MNFNNTAVPFSVYFLLDFYDKFTHAIAMSDLNNEQKNIATSFASRMVNYEDAMIPIEELATVHAATEFTIFLSDLLERSTLEDATVLVEGLPDLVSDFIELYSLITEEDGFTEGMSEYVGDMSVEEEQIPEPEPVVESTPPKAPEMPLSEATQSSIPKEASETKEYHTAFIETVNTFSLNKTQVALVSALLPQLPKKAAILEHIIPTELTNLLQLLDEAYSNAGQNLFENKALIEQNAQAIDPSYLTELAAVNYQILETVQKETESAAESLPEFKVSKIETSTKDPVVKGQLRDYFKNEVRDQSLEFTEIISSINIHTLIPNKYEKLQAGFSSLKDLCMIHGYDGLELIAEELIALMSDGMKDKLVFTKESKGLLRSVFSDFPKMIEASDTDTEQDVVIEMISKLNEFNSSLAVIEIVSNDLFSAAQAETVAAFRQIIKIKVANLSSASSFAQLAEDFTLAQLPIQASFATQVNQLVHAEISTRIEEIKLLLRNDILEEDIALFFGAEEEPEQKVVNNTAGTLTFNDVLERPQIYQAILRKKISALKTLLQMKDVESVTLLTADLEGETTLFGAANLYEFISFYALNLENYIETPQILITEFEQYESQLANYEFNADEFGEMTNSEPENEDDDLLKDEEPDDWIKDVADVLENTATSSSSTIVDRIKIKPLFDGVDEDIKEIFTDEAQSYIETIQKQIELLQENPSDKDVLTMAEKAAHTLKGAAMMLNIETVGSIAEKIERIFEYESQHEKGINQQKLNDSEQLLSIISSLILGHVDQAETKLKELQSQPDSFASIDDSNDEDDDHDTEMLEIFQEESNEHLESIEAALTEASMDLENIQRFRQVEADALSLKSAAKMLGFKQIGELAEEIESCAEQIVKEERLLNTETIDAMKSMLKVVKELSLGHTISVDQITTAVEDIQNQVEPESVSNETNAAELFIEESIDVITALSESFDRLKQNSENKKELEAIASHFYQISSAASTVGFKTVAKLAKENENLAQKFVQSDKAIPNKAFTLIHRSISELIKVSKLIEETGTDNSPTSLALIDDIKLTISGVETVETKATIALDSSDAVVKRSQFQTKLNSLKSLITDLESSNEEKTDRKVVLKSLNDVVDQIEQLEQNISNISSSVHENATKLQKIEDNDDQVDAKEVECHIFEINDELYAIRSSFVHGLNEVNSVDAMDVDGERHIFVNEHNHTLISLASLLGINAELPEKITVLSYLSANKHFAITAPSYLSEMTLSLQEITEGEKRSMCDATSFDDKKRLIFVLSQSFLDQKVSISTPNEEAEQPKINKIKKKTVSAGNVKALVADDSQSIRRFMTEILNNLGFDTVAASDGEDALTKFKKTNFDVLITDIEMPHLNGYELIESIRKERQFDNIPLMVLTGRSSEKDKDEALSRGANAYILKPFKELELKQKLSEFFNFKKG